MFSTEPHCIYEKNQLGNVICQLRFPEILTIQTTVPDQFQERIRADYPDYQLRQEPPAPRPGQAPQTQPTNNYQFASQDGAWRVNLTSRFLSLTTARYVSWEQFAQQLDKPLAAFIQVYKPAYFERIGLRYINIVSRHALELEERPFRDLFTPCYLGLLDDDEVAERSCTQATTDVDVAIRGGARVKIHAGPGMVNVQGKKDSEVKFIFDQDLYMPGKIPVNLSAGALETLHRQAFPIFRDAITTALHDAMQPQCEY